ncbi:hypothetical protein HOY80DRAFT_997134 [Tuber brumale]|nr:hypothetical protein HOY80DRAFT_997134 [Tuber brumale]
MRFMIALGSLSLNSITPSLRMQEGTIEFSPGCEDISLGRSTYGFLCSSTHFRHCAQEKRRSIDLSTRETAWAGIPLVALYVGVAVATRVDDKTVRIGVSIHDSVYSIDYCINQLTIREDEDMRDFIKADASKTVGGYSAEFQARFVGAGPLVHIGTIPIDVDKQADSTEQKFVMSLGPSHSPALAIIAFRGWVVPGGQDPAELIEGLRKCENNVYKHTWNTVLEYAYELRGYKDAWAEGASRCPTTKMVFFLVAPQGDGVVLIRPALVWVGSGSSVKINRRIPKLNPKAFRITETNHNALQGVVGPEVRFGKEKRTVLNEWVPWNKC